MTGVLPGRNATFRGEPVQIVMPAAGGDHVIQRSDGSRELANERDLVFEDAPEQAGADDADGNGGTGTDADVAGDEAPSDETPAEGDAGADPDAADEAPTEGASTSG